MDPPEAVVFSMVRELGLRNVMDQGSSWLVLGLDVDISSTEYPQELARRF
jgi:hypothetical protein